MICSFRLPTHSRYSHRHFLMIPSYFKIGISAIRDEFVTQGHKGLDTIPPNLPLLSQFARSFCLLVINRCTIMDANSDDFLL